MSKELNLEQVTPQEYRQWLQEQVKDKNLPKSELTLYHVRWEDRVFSETDGHKMTRPSLQKFNIKEWGSNPSLGQWDYFERKRTGSKDRFTYTVLFNPREKEEMKPVDEEPAQAPDGSDTAETKEKAPKGKKKNEDKINLG
jgi:hypothetical protein